MRAPLVSIGDVFSKLAMRLKVAGEEIFRFELPSSG
jgi:hypothetical protein